MEDKMEMILQRLDEIARRLDGYADDAPNVMDIERAAEYMKISVGRLKQLRIPHYRRWRRSYYKRSDVDEWLTSGDEGEKRVTETLARLDLQRLARNTGQHKNEGGKR